MDSKAKRMKKPRFPSAPTILIMVAAIVTLLTWIVPAGKYESLTYHAGKNKLIQSTPNKTVELSATQGVLDSLNVKIPIEKFKNGDIYKPIGIPGTYKKLDPQPQGIGAFLQSPVKGIVAAADIIFLILIIGGLIGIMNKTGAFDAGINWLASVLKGREYMLILAVTILIATGGTTFGLSEETMAFYPILIPVFLAAGYDAMVGFACIFIGSAIGAMGSTINPFSTIIASDAAGINWTTGLNDRLILLISGLIVAIIYIVRYAKKVRLDPSKSIIYAEWEIHSQLFGVSSGTTKFTVRLRLIIAVFSACFLIMVLGVSAHSWWFEEMTACFLVGAVIIGVIGKLGEKEFIEEFVKGAGDLLGVAFIVGIARGVTVIMEDGLISDSILFYTSTLTEDMVKGVFINSMLFVFMGLSFFVSSSSGLAVLTMPIFSPLADTMEIGREVVVNAFQFGNGLFYLVNPTSLILPALAIVKIDFDKWLRFILPLLLILLILIILLLTFSIY